MDEKLLVAVQRLKSGEVDAFEEVYKESYRYMYTTVHYMINDNEVEEDVLQEIYFDIYKGIPKLKDDSAFMAWATQIARCKCAAQIKKMQNKRNYELEGECSELYEDVSDDEAFIPENVLDNAETVKMIRQIILELPDMQRLCVIGYYFNEQKQDEIASELGIPLNTVKTHLSRAKSKMKETLITLEKKDGVRLYTMAPFMLLLFSKEVEATAVQTMSIWITNAIASSKTTVIKSLQRLSIKMKIGIVSGLGTVAVVGTIIIGSNGNCVNEDKMVPDKPLEEQIVVAEDIAVIGSEEKKVENIKTTKEFLRFTTSFSKDMYDGYGMANGGVIPVKKGELWGAVNYKNVEVIPFEHEVFWAAPNEQGYTVFGQYRENLNGEQYTEYVMYSHDASCRYSSSDIIRASGNFYEIERYDVSSTTMHEATIREFYNYDGELVFINENEEVSNNHYGFIDGRMMLVRSSFEEELNDMTLQMDFGYMYEDGTVEWEELNSAAPGLEEFKKRATEHYSKPLEERDNWIPTYFPKYALNTCHDGYYVMCNPILCGPYYAMYNENHEFVSSINLYDLTPEEGGYSNYPNEESNFEYGFRTIYMDGQTVYNVGPYMVLQFGENDILIDMTKGGGGEDANPVDFIVAAYDTIIFADEKYLVCAEGDEWFLIDFEGNAYYLYDDYSIFNKGLCVVLKEGMAYCINEDFEIVQELGEADAVTYMGELFIVEKDGIYNFYEIIE